MPESRALFETGANEIITPPVRAGGAGSVGLCTWQRWLFPLGIQGQSGIPDAKLRSEICSRPRTRHPGHAAGAAEASFLPAIQVRQLRPRQLPDL